MTLSPDRELRRETLQRAIYSRFNSHPELAKKLPLYSDVWLFARHAVEAMLEIEPEIEPGASAAAIADDARKGR